MELLWLMRDNFDNVIADRLYAVRVNNSTGAVSIALDRKLSIDDDDDDDDHVDDDLFSGPWKDRRYRS